MAKKDLMSSVFNKLTEQKPKNNIEVVATRVKTEEEQAATETAVPQLTEEEVKALEQQQKKARTAKSGRPRKWDRDQNGTPQRADGYRRTSMIVNVELGAKLKEIAFREGLTEKDVLEAAMRKAVESYEEKNGKIVPTDRDKLTAKGLF